jgi:hypothetical protein
MGYPPNSAICRTWLHYTPQLHPFILNFLAINLHPKSFLGFRDVEPAAFSFLPPYDGLYRSAGKTTDGTVLGDLVLCGFSTSDICAKTQAE